MYDIISVLHVFDLLSPFAPNDASCLEFYFCLLLDVCLAFGGVHICLFLSLCFNFVLSF